VSNIPAPKPTEDHDAAITIDREANHDPAEPTVT
jgi:hypothetical protein